MRHFFSPQFSLNNKIFKRLFGSYIFIIVLCFAAYSGIVIHETVTMKREQAKQMCDMKMQELISFGDNQFVKAANVAAGINNSYLIRRFYMGAVKEKSVDAYLLYQMVNELQYQKAASESFYIYDVALFFRNYNKAYTGGSVVLLNPEDSDTKAVSASGSGNTFLQVTTLNELMGTENPELLFFKKFLIYHSPFAETMGSSRGDICVLMDVDGFRTMADRAVGEQDGWTIFWEGEPILSGGREKGKVFEGISRTLSGVTYELRADPAEFGLSSESIWSVALGVGFAVCLCYCVLAYVFAYRYYKPWGHIRQLVGSREQEDGADSENEMSRIVIDVENLVGERDNYKEQMITISPYAERGMLHSILSGSWDGEQPDSQPLKKLIRLEKMYVLVAAVSLAYTGPGVCEKEEIRRIKKLLRQKAEEYSGESLRILCQEQEAFLVYLVVNSDDGEKMEDVLYDYYAEVSRAIGREDYVLTLGVDEVREQVSHLDEACAHGRRALRGMLTGGRGSIYFYEEQQEERADYYFPHDGVRLLVKLLKENNQKGLEEFLDTLAEKNQREYDLSLTAIQLLEDELYMTTVKAVHTISNMYTLSIRVEQPVLAMTFEELKHYYRQVYQTVCVQIGKQTEEGSEIGLVEQDIFRYVDAHYTDKDISLTYITEKFHVSNKYVSYVFKKQFGITYLQYVQEKRIAYAVRLLKSTDDTMEKIADSCGYSNLLTFRRNFKAIMDVNPSDFPRHQQENTKNR